MDCKKKTGRSASPTIGRTCSPIEWEDFIPFLWRLLSGMDQENGKESEVLVSLCFRTERKSSAEEKREDLGCKRIDVQKTGGEKVSCRFGREICSPSSGKRGLTFKGLTERVRECFLLDSHTKHVILSDGRLTHRSRRRRSSHTHRGINRINGMSATTTHSLTHDLYAELSLHSKRGTEFRGKEKRRQSQPKLQTQESGGNRGTNSKRYTLTV